MSGYQFVHFEAYSRSGGKGGRSVGYVLDEAERRPSAVPHVEHPKPPVVVYGMSVAAVRALHDERCADARQEIAGGRSRAIRKDQHTLLTAVASHPIPNAQVRDDPSAAAAVAAWERRTVAWLHRRYGSRLVSVLRHDDEAHPHLHAYVLPDDPAMRASALHDGMAAKTAAMAGSVPADPDERKERNRIGDRAYRDAMRAVQSDYWTSVGLPCGLARLGPGRRRLTREAWQAEKTASAAQAMALEGARKLQERGNEYVAQTKAKCAAASQRTLQALTEAERKREAAEAELKTARRAKAEAQRVLAEARQAAAPARSVGAVVGNVLGAARETLTAREAAIRREAEAAIAAHAVAAEKLVKSAEDKASRANQELRNERQRLANLKQNTTDIAAQRDAAWRRIAELEPNAPRPGRRPPGIER